MSTNLNVNYLNMKMRLLILTLPLILRLMMWVIFELQLVGVGRTATVQPIINTGYISEIFLNNDSSGFSIAPLVSISTSPSSLSGSLPLLLHYNVKSEYNISGEDINY